MSPFIPNDDSTHPDMTFPHYHLTDNPKNTCSPFCQQPVSHDPLKLIESIQYDVTVESKSVTLKGGVVILQFTNICRIYISETVWFT